jgi:hypothetical protein
VVGVRLGADCGVSTTAPGRWIEQSPCRRHDQTRHSEAAQGARSYRALSAAARALPSHVPTCPPLDRDLLNRHLTSYAASGLFLDRYLDMVSVIFLMYGIACAPIPNVCSVGLNAAS